MPPDRLRHFLFTWLKTQGIDDALIQPYSGHASRTSIEIYSRFALSDTHASYDKVIDRSPSHRGLRRYLAPRDTDPSTGRDVVLVALSDRGDGRACLFELASILGREKSRVSHQIVRK